jgi:hypothetical protein
MIWRERYFVPVCSLPLCAWSERCGIEAKNAGADRRHTSQHPRGPRAACVSHSPINLRTPRLITNQSHFIRYIIATNLNVVDTDLAIGG